MPARVVPLKNEAFALVWFHRDEVKSEYDDDWYGCVHPVEFYPGNMKIYHESLVSAGRSEEHTSELQSLMRISYAVLCLKKKTTTATKTNYTQALPQP